MTEADALRQQIEALCGKAVMLSLDGTDTTRLRSIPHAVELV